MSEGEINYPEWSEYRPKNGLDPLGMQNSAVSLYQEFLPGISNVTLRVRYYGFYVWLCRAYLREIGDTDPTSWKRIVRRAEALYALIVQRRGGESGDAGVEWAQKTLEALEGDEIDFCDDTEPGSETHYLAQKWGVFGQAYRSQLFEIGLFTESGHTDIPLPSPESGERLADGFEAALGAKAEQFFEVARRGVVTLDELDALAEFAPSAISGQGDERSLYEQLLLAPSSEVGSRDQSRRLSILLVMKVAALLAKEPRQEEVRWAIYAGCDQNGSALALEAESLFEHAKRWRVYHANDLCHVAMETLLKFTLDTLADFPAGIPARQLIDTITAQILEAMPSIPESWDEFIAKLEIASNAYDPDTPISEWKLSQDIMRSVGRVETSRITADTAWKALLLFATLNKRAVEQEEVLEASLAKFNPELFRSLLSELRFMGARGQQLFAKTLAELIEQRVINRHLWVALKKLRFQRDYTFLIEVDEGKLRCKDKDGPVFTNPRLGPTLTFLKDLHILGADGLTSQGAELLADA